MQVYRGPEGESTQWQDIHRKLGNLPEKAPVWRPDVFTPEKEEAKDKQWIDKKGEEDLEDLEDEFVDQRFLEKYRCACVPPRHAGVHGSCSLSALCIGCPVRRPVDKGSLCQQEIQCQYTRCAPYQCPV